MEFAVLISIVHSANRKGLSSIYFLSRSQPVFAMISRSFSEFVEELVRRDCKLVDWVNTLATQAYR